jgi:hypothetical protein
MTDYPGDKTNTSSQSMISTSHLLEKKNINKNNTFQAATDVVRRNSLARKMISHRFILKLDIISITISPGARDRVACRVSANT